MGSRAAAVPSVIYLGEDGTVLVGEAAERRGTSSPERVVREFKRRIGDAVPIMVGDLFVTPESVFATVVGWVVDRTQEREGQAPECVVVSHPASWGDYKIGLIREALAAVGLANVTLLSEPEAAALHYGSQTRVPAGSLIAVYDFGGGTFDAAVLRKDDTSSFTLLGRPEGLDRVGGADVDDLVFDHVAASLDGGLSRVDLSAPQARVALGRIRRECVEAKEALSADSEATIPVLLPEVQTGIRLVRTEFEGLIEPVVRDTVGSLNRALEAANVTADDLTAVLLTGGSSRIPLVAQMLSATLGRPIAKDTDPKASISLGAAYFVARNQQALANEQALALEQALAHSHSTQTLATSKVSGRELSPEGIPAPVGQPITGEETTRRHAFSVRAAAVTVAVATLTALTATAAQSPQDFGLFGSLPGIAQGNAAERNSYMPGGAAQQSDGAGPANSVMAAEPVQPGMSPVVSWDTPDAKAADKAGQGGADGTPTSGAPGNAPQDQTARTSPTTPDGTPSTGGGGTPTGAPGTPSDPGANSGTGTPAPANPGTPAPTQPAQPSPAPAPSTPVPEPVVTPEPTTEPEPQPAETPPAAEPTPSESAVEAPPADAPTSPASTGPEQPVIPAPEPTASVPA
ncbi:Hsp70 family protein [Arthrobacter sp. CAU 1506]|uniref:Hsp70 family protein n=1 Tax=Arthrobacter sp. CAU 1506 TaxID=2560052 RepID=UPI001F0DB3BD|nr:Hsp70 family protein [Arthrobacter sp. CAU 1506]